MRIKALIFDFDNTIADNTDNTDEDVFEIIQKYNNNAIFKDALKKIQEATTDYQICEFFLSKDNIHSAYKEILEINIKKVNSAYYSPEMKNIINTLYERDYQLFIFSGRDEKSLMHSLRKEQLVDYFKEIISGDSYFSPKPSMEAINYIIKKYNFSINDVLYIGDSDTDYLMSKNVGCNFLAAKWYKKNMAQSAKNNCNKLNDLMKSIDFILGG